MNSKSNKQMASIVKDFSQAEAWLIALVGRILATSDLSSLRARRKASRDAAQILDQLRGLTASKAAALVKSSYLAGREASKAPNKSLAATDRIALQLLVDNIRGRLEDSITTVGRRVDDVFRREALRATALTLTGPGIVDEASVKRFHARLIKEGVTSFTDSRGGHWKMETYARMALKTTMMEAVNTGAENLIRERGFDVIQIGYVGQFEPDKLCSPHHLKKYSLFGRTDHPLFGPTDKPPYHPQCEHFIKLAPEAAAERRRSLRAA
jgi:Phage minor capsid protein 2